MEDALIVSSSEKASALFASLLHQYTQRQITASSGGEARRMLIERNFDIVIISAPLSDEFGHELSIKIAEDSDASVILIVKAELLEDVSSRVEEYGILVLPNPLNKQLFYGGMRIMIAAQNKIRNVIKEREKLQDRIEEIRLVDRAKCTLIQYLKLSEPQAHRYIEKQAMDRRMSKSEIAIEILKAYEN